MIVSFSRREFLEALFDDYFADYEGFIMVKVVGVPDRKVSVRYFPSIDVLARQHYTDDQNVFFGVCPRETMKPRPENEHRLSALWAALDFGSEGHSGRSTYFKIVSQAALAVRRFPHPPSIIVESGWGLHLYWLLKDLSKPSDVNRIQKLVRGMNDYFQCSGVVGIDSALRLPDTVNSKMVGVPAKCRVKYLNPDFRYTIEDFENLDPRFLAASSSGSGEAEGGNFEEPPPQLDSAGPATEQIVQAGDETAAIEETLSQVMDQTADEAVEILDEFSSEEWADRIADRVVQRIRHDLIEEIVEKIVERLANRPRGN